MCSPNRAAFNAPPFVKAEKFAGIPGIEKSPINGSETGTSFKQALFFQSIGFNLHDTMIFRKQNPIPQIYRKRYSNEFEYMFVFSKGFVKTHNAIMVDSQGQKFVKSISSSTGNGVDIETDITSRIEDPHMFFDDLERFEQHPIDELFIMLDNNAHADVIYQWSSMTDIDGYKTDNMNPAYLMTSAAVPKSQRISGIVIDAREHAVDPSMSPEVIDMQGNLVYGTTSYSRSKSVNRGPVGYAYSMDDRNVSQRVGSNPLFIEAVGSLDDDVYITSMDADKVRNAEKSFGVLSNCRVMLLLQ